MINCWATGGEKLGVHAADLRLQEPVLNVARYMSFKPFAGFHDRLSGQQVVRKLVYMLQSLQCRLETAGTSFGAECCQMCSGDLSNKL